MPHIPKIIHVFFTKIIDVFVPMIVDSFCSGAIWLAMKLHKFLIGPLPSSEENVNRPILRCTTERGRGRIAQFIQFVLHYPPLFSRLAVASIAWCLLWLLGVALAAKLALLAFEVYASLLLIRFFASAPRLGQFGKIIAAMWLPIGVIAIAIYLLFVNDQGRELGIGLMDLNKRGIFLGLALVYWALNNWLSARIGLDRAFPEPEPEPEKEQELLFWGPRIVGVCAHLVAAVSLSFAAWKQPDLQEWWLVPAAPLAIVLATIFVWRLDKCLSHRYQRHEQLDTRKSMYVVGGVEFLVLLGLIAAWLFDVQPGFSSATLCVTLSALFFLILISLLRYKAPLGKGASSEARKKDAKFEQNLTIFSTLILAAFMLGGGAAVWIWPMQIGQLFGSLTIACFSFGSFLALANLLDLLTSGVARYARGADFAVEPRAVGAIFLCVLALPAIWSSFQAFHRVRLCETGCSAATKDWSAVEIPAERPSVSKAALAWYAQAERAYHSIHPKEDPVPLLIVATAGGGIRAAYWTATILEKLETDLRRENLGPPEKKILTENLMRNLLFAISGVSGGSVGAAAYAASVHDHEINDTMVLPTSYLREDFLAPGLAAMVFIDGPANVLPDFGQIDRGEALERGFEYASRTNRDKDGLLSHKFLSFFPAIKEDTILYSWRPALLLNATHQETGRRIITSHLKIERDIFRDSYDALHVLNSDVRLSTAAHNSARFTYVSPAGNLQSSTTPTHHRGYIIDGGYFENYGARTALELARKAIEAIDPDYGKPDHQNKIKLVILQISSDPTLREDRTLVRARPQGDRCTLSNIGRPRTANDSQPDQDNYLDLIDSTGWSRNEGEIHVFSSANELSAPLVGIMSVRQAHGTIAAAELAASICQGERKVEVALQNAIERKTTADANESSSTAAGGKNDSPHFTHMAMCEISSDGKAGISPPLGWVLSDRTRSKFSRILRDCGNPKELSLLEQALGLLSPAPSN